MSKLIATATCGGGQMAYLVDEVDGDYLADRAQFSRDLQVHLRRLVDPQARVVSVREYRGSVDLANASPAAFVAVDARHLRSTLDHAYHPAARVRAGR